MGFFLFFLNFLQQILIKHLLCIGTEMAGRITEIPVQPGIQSNGRDMQAVIHRVTGAIRGKYNYHETQGRGGDGETALQKKHAPGVENRKHKGHEITKEHGELSSTN